MYSTYSYLVRDKTDRRVHTIKCCFIGRKISACLYIERGLNVNRKLLLIVKNILKHYQTFNTCIIYYKGKYESPI